MWVLLLHIRLEVVYVAEGGRGLLCRGVQNIVPKSLRTEERAETKVYAEKQSTRRMQA